MPQSRSKVVGIFGVSLCAITFALELKTNHYHSVQHGLSNSLVQITQTTVPFPCPTRVVPCHATIHQHHGDRHDDDNPCMYAMQCMYPRPPSLHSQRSIVSLTFGSALAHLTPLANLCVSPSFPPKIDVRTNKKERTVTESTPDHFST